MTTTRPTTKPLICRTCLTVFRPDPDYRGRICPRCRDGQRPRELFGIEPPDLRGTRILPHPGAE
jgi:hypothetical protein